MVEERRNRDDSIRFYNDDPFRETTLQYNAKVPSPYIYIYFTFE
jgi:hypothetical protein